MLVDIGSAPQYDEANRHKTMGHHRSSIKTQGDRMLIKGGRPRRYAFFDLGDTLLQTKPQVYQGWAKRISGKIGRTIKPKELIEAIRAEWRDPSRVGRSLPEDMSEEKELSFLHDFYLAVLRRLGILESNAEASETSSWGPIVDQMAQQTINPDSFEKKEEMWSMARELREQGVRVGIISNAFPSVQALVKHFELETSFEPIVLSYKESVAKPERRIYKIALKRAGGVAAQNAILIDDRKSFVRGAQAVGMRASLPEYAERAVSAPPKAAPRPRTRRAIRPKPGYRAPSKGERRGQKAQLAVPRNQLLEEPPDF